MKTNRQVAAVGAQRRMPQRPVGRQVRCRRPQVLHLSIRKVPDQKLPDAKSGRLGQIPTSKFLNIDQQNEQSAGERHAPTAKSVALEPPLSSPKALPDALPSGCSVIRSTRSAACSTGAKPRFEY